MQPVSQVAVRVCDAIWGVSQLATSGLSGKISSWEYHIPSISIIPDTTGLRVCSTPDVQRADNRAAHLRLFSGKQSTPRGLVRLRTRPCLPYPEKPNFNRMMEPGELVRVMIGGGINYGENSADSSALSSLFPFTQLTKTNPFTRTA